MSKIYLKKIKTKPGEVCSLEDGTNCFFKKSSMEFLCREKKYSKYQCDSIQDKFIFIQVFPEVKK